jgi:hypothetical protein
VQGADRSGGRVFRSNNGATISFTLLQFSASNDVLMELWKKDAEARDNTWLFNLTIVDGTGRSVFHARQCFIQNLPTASFGTDAENRQWNIQAVELDEYVGGNAKLPPEVLNTLTLLGATVSPRWI